MTPQKIVELISSGLAIPTLVFCAIVVVLWKSAAFKIIKQQEIKTSQDWFILGVFFGFCGEFLDNIYWSFTWIFIFLNLPFQHDAAAFGAWANIPSRQILGIIAAYCHARSAVEYGCITHEKTKRLNKMLKLSFIAGGILMYTLYILKDIYPLSPGFL